MQKQDSKGKLPNIRPLADRVLVEVISSEEFTTASGLIIPQGAEEENTKQGRVLRVSNQIAQAKNDWEQLNTGDLVVFSQFAGSDIKLGNNTYKMMRFTDVFGVIE